MREDKQYKYLAELMQAAPIVERNTTPPKCGRCLYFQPKFRYRKCLYACCPYGKDANYAFRKKPLKKEKMIQGG